MFASNFWKQPWRMLGAAAAVMLLAAGLTNVAKPGTVVGTGGGKIYFGDGYVMSTMNSDGSAKTALPQWPPNFSEGEPSQALHNSHRWFLQTGETTPTTYYPNGQPRHELFAFSDDGVTSVPLTTQSDLQADGGAGTRRWAMGDGVVSWIARRWDLTNAKTPTVLEGGIYYAVVAFDASGVPSLTTQPLAPLVPLDLSISLPGDTYFGGYAAPNISSHDWAPNGLDIVHDRLNRAELWVADAVFGKTVRILATDHANQPVWSPDGTRIAFQSSAGIDTVAPNGGSRSTIIKWAPTYSVGSPRWSPTGSHLTYRWWDRRLLPQGVWDIYRATAIGGGKTNLTKDIGGTPSVFGWR